MERGFQGFSKDSLTFFALLKKNNRKSWFDEHRLEYETYVKAPAAAFVVDLGAVLAAIAPNVCAIPKINQSLFRLNRDVRFSKDKTPYKTNLGLWWWEGTGKRMACSGFYFHLEDERLRLGTGLYRFTKPMLDRFRTAVVDQASGPAITRIIKKLATNQYLIDGRHFKKIPSGYDPQHPNASLLLFNGLYANIDLPMPEAAFTADLVDFCFQHFRRMLPLHSWLKEHVANRSPD
jgi:uncharacterized protein (TIGR02453 family)